MRADRGCLVDLAGVKPGQLRNCSINLAKLCTRLSILLALFVAFSLLPFRAEGQSPNSGLVVRKSGQTDIFSNTPRPMSATVHALGEEFGWTVDYEDPPHAIDSSDVYDMSDPSWRSTHPDTKPFIGLRGGSFTTKLSPAEAGSVSTPITMVERIVSEYNKASQPGHFSVRFGEEGRISVVGTATRNSSGAYVQAPVLLDTQLELTSSTMTLYEALSMVTSALAKSSGHQVEVGTAPTNLVLGTQCATPSGRLPSRVAIDRILDSAPVRLAYYLLHDLNQDLYVLNVGLVTRVSTNAHGEEERSTVRQRR